MTCDEVFEVLARSDASAEEKKAAAAHLEGCEECRRMKQGLAAYDEALEAPERFEKDPPHVRDAILAASRKKAAEYAAMTATAQPASRAAAPWRSVRVAAAVVVLLAAGFIAGRLTAPRREIVIRQDGPTVGIDSSTRSQR